MDFFSKNLEDTKNAAKKLLENISGDHNGRKTAVVVGLYGELGSGKTTFTQAVGSLLGVKESMASPTFVIEKIYKINSPTAAAFKNLSQFIHLIHIDAYRLESPEEIRRLGWSDLLADPQNLILVEWPERIAAAMPEKHTRIYLEHIDENTRKIIIQNQNQNQNGSGQKT